MNLIIKVVMDCSVAVTKQREREREKNEDEKTEEILSGINNSKCIRKCSGMSGSPCVTGIAFIESVGMSSCYTSLQQEKYPGAACFSIFLLRLYFTSLNVGHTHQPRNVYTYNKIMSGVL